MRNHIQNIYCVILLFSIVFGFKASCLAHITGFVHAETDSITGVRKIVDGNGNDLSLKGYNNHGVLGEGLVLHQLGSQSEVIEWLLDPSNPDSLPYPYDDSTELLRRQ